ncbi:hypothetical protein [Dickeya fangzhongdai]|uniref:hypothetical protein n=1 Tax=Dickeya fangzhongdai TaxID=1778540 RepID=UPI001AD9B2E6|nr:hypothetical protein [Dickeya fangzhongdai]MBO8135539.1 hypothetical protein [Dickeya fangzhongdai]
MNSTTELTIVSEERLNELYSSYAEDKRIQEQFGDGDYANESGDIMSIIAEVKSLRAQLAEHHIPTMQRLIGGLEGLLFAQGAELAELRGQEPVAFRWRLSATADCGASDWTYLPVDRAKYFIDLVAEKDTSVEYEYVYAAPVPAAASQPFAVPDFRALAENLVENIVDLGSATPEYEEQLISFAEKACRAAMLQAGNSPVIPDSSSDHIPDATKMVSAAVRDVIAERQHQITAEGWTPEHDDEHVGFEMSFAAATYILHIAQSYGGQPYKHITPSEIWPWDLKWLKFAPGPRRSLVKAAALILAEIDRLDRAAHGGEGGNRG